MALTPVTGGRSAGRRHANSALNRWGALVAVCLATLMMLIDFMAVSVALPAIHHSLGASFGQLQWVLEAFVVTLAAFVLTAGYIADVVGHRAVFLGGLFIFAGGSLMAGVAPSIYILIGGRVVQGMGGALVFSTGAVQLTETFRVKSGRVALAVWGTVTGLAVAVSPLIGGVITDALGWRWVFLVDVPAAGIALLTGALSIRVPSAPEAFAPEARRSPAEPRTEIELPPPPDWRGLGLFTAAIAILVIGLVRTTTTLGGWSGSGILTCFACTGLLLVAFVAVETVSTAPMIDISLFKQRTFTGSSIAAFGLSMAVLGPFMLLVIYLSYDLGYSALGIGTRLLLLTGMTLPFVPLTGWLDRFVPVKLLICTGLFLVACGLWDMSRLTATSTWHDLLPGLIAAGIGLELVNPRLALAAAATVEPRLAAVASRTSSTFRQLGTATGVAVLGSVFATRLTDDITKAISRAPALGGQGPAQIANLVLQDRTNQATSPTAGDGGVVLAIIHQSFADAMHEVFLVSVVVALASAALALVIRSSDVPRRDLASPAEPRTGLRAASEPPASTVPTTVHVAGSPAAPLVEAAPPAAPAPPAPPVPAGPADDLVPAHNVMEFLAAFMAVRGHAPAAGTAPAPTAHGGTTDHADGVYEDDVSPPAASEEPAASDEPVRAAGNSGAGAQNDLVRSPAAVLDPGANGSPRFIDLTGARHRRVRGHVTATTGEAVAGATVSLVGPDGDEAGHAVAGADGSFYLLDISEGTYTLVAAAPNYRATASILALRAEGADAFVSLLGTGSLAGRVTRAKDHSPLEAVLELISPNGNLAMQCQSDYNGGFIFPDVLEGEYDLIVHSAGYRQGVVTVVVRRGSRHIAQVALVGLGHLYGAVSAPEGGWLPGVLVTLTDEPGALVTTTQTDDAGSYQFPGVVEGRYTVGVAAPGSSTLAVCIEPGATIAADLTLDAKLFQ